MLVVKRIKNFIFPVVCLPESKNTQDELRKYLDNPEEKKVESFKALSILVIIILAINFYIWLMDSITINYKLLLSIPQSVLFLEVIYLRIEYKREPDTLEAVKIKSKFVLILFLSFMVASGNIILSFLITNGIINTADKQQGFIIIIGEVGYFISYVIGYRLQYKKVVDNLLRKSRMGEKTKMVGVGYSGIGSLLVLMTYRYGILSESILILIFYILVAAALFMASVIEVNCRFYNKLCEERFLDDNDSC